MRLLLFLLPLLFSSIVLFSQNVSKKEILSVKQEFEFKHNLVDTKSIEKALLSGQDTLAYVYNYKNAFIVISNKKQLPPIKAYSIENSFPIADDKSEITFENMIVDDLKEFNNVEVSARNNKYITKNISEWKHILNNGIEDSKEEYGPLLNNLYGQVNCKNENGSTVNVTNYYTPNNYAVGCVAITFVELLQYHKWPRIGVGSHTYTDNYGSTTGNHNVDFDDKYYNWALVLDEYNNKSTSSQERLELGKITYNCAVSIDMDFEYNGSTSNVNRIPEAANKYFRFSSRYIQKSNAGFWNYVNENIINSLPVQFAIYTSSGAGHAVVCDGLKPDNDLYHLNMGWWGSSNAWYAIQGDFNAGGYSNITAAVLDFIPIPEIGKPIINIEDEVVDLVWYYPNTITPDAYHLQVKIGAGAWKDVDDDIIENTYSYEYSSTEIHNFRVSAKVFGVYTDNSWSEYEDINIQSEIDNSVVEELNVFPSPSHEKISIESKYIPGSSVEIFNTQGLLVFYENIPTSYLKSVVDINISNYNQGMYILKLQNRELVQVSQFIKF